MRTEPQSPAITLPRMQHATAISRRGLPASLAGAGGATLVGGLGGTARAATARAGFTPEPAVAADVRNQFLHGYIQDSQPPAGSEPAELGRHGRGHPVRCLALGAALRQRGHRRFDRAGLVGTGAAVRARSGRVRHGEGRAGRAGRSSDVALGDRGIRANAVLPGAIAVERNAWRWREPDAAQQMSSRNPLGRLGKPEDVANVVTFLASGKAAFVNGPAFPSTVAGSRNCRSLEPQADPKRW